MKKRLLTLLILTMALFLGNSQKAKADVTNLSASDGWIRLEAMPDNWNDYYYVIADWKQNLMMQLRMGASQGTSYNALWYEAPQDPFREKTVVWTFEKTLKSDGFTVYWLLRNEAYPDYFLQTESGKMYYYRTHDNGGGDKSWGRLTIKTRVTNGAFQYFYIKNGKDGGNLYLGPWDDNANADNLPLHSETALNKSESLQGHFIIYAIKKTDYNAKRAAILEEALDNATAEEPQDISFLIDNPKMELALSGTKWVKEAGAGSQGGPAANRIFRFYNETGKMSQTITGLRDGIYRVKCSSFYREGSAPDAQALYDAGTEQHYGVVFANDAQAPVKSIFAGAKSARDDANGFSLHQGSYYIPDGTTNLAKAIATGAYDGNEVEVAVSGGTLKFGVMNTQHVNLDYLPMDNFELWYYGPFQTGIHELGAPSMNMSAKGYVTTGVPAAFQLTFPNNVSSDGEAISLISAAGITIDGAAASATFTDGTLSFAIPNSIGTHTITVPAQTLGFATSRVYNETITLTYTVIQPTLPEAKSGYLYTMVNDAPRFLTRGHEWNQRAILGDHGLAIEMSASDGDDNTTVKFLDNGGMLYSSNNVDLYTDGTTNNITFQLVKVGEGQYKLKANNSLSTGYFGVNDLYNLNDDRSEANALVWQFMSQADYTALLAKKQADLTKKALDQVGLTVADYAGTTLAEVKSSTETGTKDIAEIYYAESKNWAVINKTWEYTVDPGLYVVKINAFLRNCGAAAYSQMIEKGYDGHMAFLKVNGDSIRLHSVWDGHQSTAIAEGSSTSVNVGGQTAYFPFSQAAAGYLYTNSNCYSNELLTYVGSDGKLNISLYDESFGVELWLSYRDLTVSRVITSINDTKQMAINEINGYEGDDAFEALAATAVSNINAATTLETIANELENVRNAFTAFTYGISDWSHVNLTADIENEAIKPLLAADYSWLGAKPVVTEENRSISDTPRPISIPVKRTAEELTVSITETEGNYAGCFTTTASGVKGTIDCHYNGIPGHTYYYKVENAAHDILTQGQFNVTGMLRMIYAEGGSNIRDLGGRVTVDGKRVKYGRIFRGAEMHVGKQTNLTASGLKTIEELGIKGELDLRAASERSSAATTSAIPGADYLFVDLGPHDVSVLTNPDYQVKIKDGVHFIAETLKKGNAYFHCIWGADRTGIMGMLIESILGVQLSDIEKDYQLTSFSKAGLRPNTVHNPINDKIIYIQNNFEGNTIQEKVVSFLKSIGVTDGDIATIRTEALEDDTDAMASYLATIKAAYGKVATAAGVTLTETTSVADATADINAKMATLTEVKDITSLLHNANFEDNAGTPDGWATVGSGIGKGGSSANYVARIFDKTGSIDQTLQNMPAGTYIVKAQAFDRKGSGNAETTKGENYAKYLSGEMVADAYLMANDSKTTLRNLYEDAQTTAYENGYNPTYGVYVPENSTSGAVAMTTDGGRLYWNVATVTLEKAGDLNIGINVPTNATGDYIVFDNFKLYYVSPNAEAVPTLNLDETSTANTLPTEDGYYNLTSNRTLAAGKWNTFCVPFDLSAAQIESLPITEVRAISDVTTDDKNATIKFVPVTEIKAGKPYIVKVSEAWNVALDNILVRAKSPVATMYENGLSMLGNYSKTVLNGQYYISSDKFYYADVDVNMKGFRASITVPEGTNIKAFGIDTDDIADALNKLEEEQQDGPVYDVLGRKLPNVKAARGIYIKNGKKFIK